MDNNLSEYTGREQMVCVAARMIEDEDLVFVGMRLPIIAFQLAVSTNAPNAVSIFESGVMRNDPADGFLHTMCDLPNLNGAVSSTNMIDIMSFLQRGEVDVGFLGGAEIDQFGNLNTTRVMSGDGRSIRLPGSGGAGDIAGMSKNTLILMPHQPRRFVKEVHYNTSPGFGTGGDWRLREDLVGNGPMALVTTKATFGFDDSGEMYLRSLHSGIDEDEVTSDFPWILNTSRDLGLGPVQETVPPTEEELNLIRSFDPDGFWTG